MGANAPECTDQNFYTIGIGPIVMTDLRPDSMRQTKVNDHDLNTAKPTFATVTFEDGGDTRAAERSMLKIREFD